MRDKRIINVFLVLHRRVSRTVLSVDGAIWSASRVVAARGHLWVGASIPFATGDCADRLRDADAQLSHGRRFSLLPALHGRKPSKIIWSAKRVARARSASLRIVQASNGKPMKRRASVGASAAKSPAASAIT